MRSSRSPRAEPGRRGRTLGRLGVALLVLCCAAAVLAPAALGKGRLDRSFGHNGVVDLGAGLAGERGLGEVAVGPRGDIFVSEDTYRCGRKLCFYDEWLKRYRADGTLARRYLPGSEVHESTAEVALAVDTRGRPLLAWDKREDHVFVRRLGRNGGVDKRFGAAGTVALPCRCRLENMAALPGGGVLIAAAREVGDYAHYRGAFWFVAKLRPDGSGDPRFGGDGFVRLWQPGRGAATATPGPHGSVLLDSSVCCDEDQGPGFGLLSRLSRRGRLDPRFGANYVRSILGPGGLPRERRSWEWSEPYRFGGDGIGLFASTYSGRGMVFGLRGDGRRDRSFGHRGFVPLSLQFASVAPDGRGGLLLVGYRKGEYRLRRLDHDGQLDRGFGTVPLPDAYNEEGLGILSQGRGKAIVVDRDLSFCRQGCSSDPKLFRVLG